MISKVYACFSFISVSCFLIDFRFSLAFSLKKRSKYDLFHSEISKGNANTPHVETVAVLLRVDDGRRDAVDEAR